MNVEPITILLIEDNPGDVRLLREMLTDGDGTRAHLVVVDRLGLALQRLGGEQFDLVLLDLSLPDAQGIETFLRLQAHAPQVPIIVLTGTNSEELAVKAVQTGAQDYLVKGEVDRNLLVRAMRYAIERHRMREVLRSMSLIDDLTGLYNRRGFTTLADQQLKFSARSKRELILFFADLDEMKQINDTYGHQMGDIALIDAADAMRETFRQSDIVARIGGDEFAILALDAGDASEQVLAQRLQANLDALNRRMERPFRLTVSIGSAHCDPDCPFTIESLLMKADTAMYEEKRRRKVARS